MPERTGDTDSGATTNSAASLLVLLLITGGFIGVALTGWRGRARFLEPLGVSIDANLWFGISIASIVVGTLVVVVFER